MRYNRLYKDNHFLTPTIYTQTVSEYLADLKYEDIPQDVMERAKLILMQTIGAALAAKDSDASQKAYRMAKEANAGDGGPITVWGSGGKLSAINAALALGTMAAALDWADCSWTGCPSTGIIPCAWIAAEERKKSGKELLTAIVGAYEISQRLAMAVQPSDKRWKEKGWGLTSWQIFACIFAVSKLYGLDARKINQAIGLGCECSTMPTTYHAVTMSDFYPFEYGYRARDGFLIAKAAEKGINNNRDTLDEPRLYIGVVCGDSAKDGNGETKERSGDGDVSWLTRDLGSLYLTKETLLKRWPANMWAQNVVEIVHDLHKENGFLPEEVETIVVDPPVTDRMWAPKNGFVSTTQAQFSIPFAIASVLYTPTPGAAWYAERLTDPSILAMAQRVKGGDSPAETPMDGFRKFRTGGYPARKVTINLKNGTTLVGEMSCPPGHPANMMTQEELVEQFRIQTASTLQGERLERAINMLANIEQCEDIAALGYLLR